MVGIAADWWVPEPLVGIAQSGGHQSPVVGANAKWWALQLSGEHQALWWASEGTGGCQSQMVGIRYQWWVPEPPNTTIFVATAGIWLGSRMLLELIGWHRRQVISVGVE